MLDITINVEEKDDDDYNPKKSSIKFEISPDNLCQYITMQVGQDNSVWKINKKDFMMISKIVGGINDGY